MNILIVYDTYSSTTETVVAIIDETLRAKSHEIKIMRVRDVASAESICGFELVIFATPSWLERGLEGQPHVSFLQFMDMAKDTRYDGMKYVVIGLGNSTYAHFCQAADILNQFMKDHGGLEIKEALKLDAYYENVEREKPRLSSWLDTLV